MKDRWTVNKLGLVNFWYYDEEEFDLIDGKLLLRGANGSGKSVTMQSFIPLLLDGNKRPERLDPFGTNARRMENYLLVGEDETERTAYLYMEFKKSQQDVYLTIGMGLKAIKGRRVDSWYFIINDGRRVKKDINLYRNKGYEKTPLTKKELENLVGDGGFYTDSQGKYKEKVNEYLFGYKDIESYEELIDLLINIRTPKLSRDFKPTAMYEILENSLRQLTEEDLRPMSEAMENMDNIKLRIEQLEVSLKAARHIDEYYKKYNKYILRDKANKFIDKDQEVKKLATEIDDLNKDTDNIDSFISRLEEEYSQLQEELETAKRKISEYKDSDVLRAKEKLEEVKVEINSLKSNKVDKERILDEKKDKLREKEYQQREKKNELEDAEKEKIDTLKELENLAMECSFSQQEIFKEDLNFSFIKGAYQKHKERLNQGKENLFEFEKKKDAYEKGLQEKDNQEKIVQGSEKKLKDALEYLTTVKEEYVEGLVKWNKSNVNLKLDEKLLQDISRGVMALEGPSKLGETSQVITDFFNQIKANKVVEKARLENGISTLKEEILTTERRIQDLKEAKEVEFNRTEEVVENRKKLEALGIPFIPLYKALDFSKEVKDSEKQAIEAALVDLGIIDALVISNKYKEQVLKNDSLGTDKYLFADANLLGYSLTEYLQVDETELDKITYQEVDDLLRSILLDGTSTIFLNEKGNYGMGILQGKASQNYELKYIGATARKLHRERIIEGLKEDIKEIQEKINIEVKELIRVELVIETLTKEFHNMPSVDDLNKSFDLINEYENEFRNNEKKLHGLKQELEALKEELGQIKKTVFEITEGLQIEKTYQGYQEALESCEEYRDELTNFERIINAIDGIGVLLNNIKEAIEGLDNDVSEKIGEINLIDQQIKVKMRDQQVYEEILSSKGYDDIKAELDWCHRIMEEAPKKIQDKTSKIATYRERVKNNRSVIETKREIYLREGELLELLKNILMEEYNLGYVIEKNLYHDPYKLSREILKITESFINKSREEYDNALHEAFNKNMGALRDYQPKTVTIFRQEIVEESKGYIQGRERKDIRCRINGKEVNFNILKESIRSGIEDNKVLLTDQEREFFQEILLKTISNKIKSKIYMSNAWVNQMNKLMESMNTSSSLRLTLKWVPKKADQEGQLDTRKLIELLEKEDGLIGQEDIDELSKHFSAKIKEVTRGYEDKNETRNYHTAIKEILDYRKWYEFKLYSKKEGEAQRELTNNAFFQLSGGEKAMSMYIPLFTAVYSKFDIADKKDCPRVIALDEAFAGVDEGNIRDMFRILKEMNLDYILNSQVLWGDYDTVEALAICEIIRPDNADVVTVFRYQWNGKEKVYIE